MSNSKMMRFIKSVRTSVARHSPELLVGIGIAGMATTTILAVRATPKALQCIEEKKYEEQVDKLTPVETIKATWKCYIPAAVTGVAATICIVGASSVHVRRNAAIATAYKLSETAFTEYREKVIETIGEKKEQVVRDNVDKARMEKKPVSKSEVIMTEKGNTLCFDSVSGRYFKSDIDHIKRAFNEINRTMVLDMYVSLNDFYDELGLDHIAIGDDLGWNVDDKLIDPCFGTQLADDGTPCIVLNYSVAPRYGYSKIF